MTLIPVYMCAPYIQPVVEELREHCGCSTEDYEADKKAVIGKSFHHVKAKCQSQCLEWTFFPFAIAANLISRLADHSHWLRITKCSVLLADSNMLPVPAWNSLKLVENWEAHATTLLSFHNDWWDWLVSQPTQVHVVCKMRCLVFTVQSWRTRELATRINWLGQSVKRRNSIFPRSVRVQLPCLPSFAREVQYSNCI